MSSFTYTDHFYVISKIDDKYLCASNDFQILIHKDFLEAHDIGLNKAFSAEVDKHGVILLETIR